VKETSRVRLEELPSRDGLHGTPKPGDRGLENAEGFPKGGLNGAKTAQGGGIFGEGGEAEEKAMFTVGIIAGASHGGCMLAGFGGGQKHSAGPKIQNLGGGGGGVGV